jgi:hypothetical protein
VGRAPDSGIYLRRRLGLVLFLAALVGGGFALASRGGGSHSSASLRGPRNVSHSISTSAITAAAAVQPAPPPPPPPLVVRAARAGSGWRAVAVVHGRPAAWVAQRAGVSLLRFDQSSVRLDLHAGSTDGGTVGWRYGDQIEPSEIHHVIAGFNGGFKFTYPDVGFLAGGRVALALKPGLASIVTYRDGRTDVGAWDEGVPSSGRHVYSVLQNQHLLVDRGVVAVNAASCISACWGETIKGLTAVARSGLGVTANGQIVWAGGESLLPGDLGRALVSAGAVRAIELDINPDWVAGYLYEHHSSGPVAVPVIPGQIGIAGQLLGPYSRDFMTIVAL